MGIDEEQRYKEIARRYVEEIEKDKNMKLDYIGAVHMKDDHPHIHLVVSGVGEDKETGQDKRLRVEFREDVPKHKDFIDKEIGADRVKEEREFDKSLSEVERTERQQQKKNNNKKIKEKKIKIQKKMY